VSVLILQGTDDPLVPYEGGGVARGRQGRIIGTEEVIRLWVQHNGCLPRPKKGALADKDATDGCKADWSLWSQGRSGSEVKLIRIVGGGHTWPGGVQYLPARWIGKVCRDFDATEVIWEFFRNHSKP